MGSDMLRPLLETLQVERESTRYLGPVRASLAGPRDDSGEGSGAICQQVAWFVNSKKRTKDVSFKEVPGHSERLKSKQSTPKKQPAAHRINAGSHLSLGSLTRSSISQTREFNSKI